MDASGFMPHGYCLLWKPDLVTLHVASDLGIGLSYFSIPLMLRYFVRKRTDVPFSWIFVMFAAFIGLCGLTHIMNVVTLWDPLYWIDGWLKAATAAVSIATAVTLFPLIPRALSLRSPQELEAVNRELESLLGEKEQLLAAYAREQHVALTLQRAMLPQTVPTIAGLRIDTAYAPAQSGVEVGGDWYDAFAVSDECIALSVGDVAGHGLRSATVMGSIRQAIRAAARDDASPASVLARANRWLMIEEPGTIASAFFGLLDLGSGEFRYARAGHPPTLLLRDGSVERLEGQGLMLGVTRLAEFEEQRARLDVGSALVMYTDGLIEVRRDLVDGLNRLEAAAHLAHAAGGENIAESIREHVFGDTLPFDDTAIMFVGVTALGALPAVDHRRSWTIDAKNERTAHQTRRALMWYLGQYGSARSDFGGSETIIGELLGNVARHTPGFAEITVEWRNGLATIEVRDHGDAFTIPATEPDILSESGRGLRLIQTLAESVMIERAGDGNRVRVALPIALE
ncbi:MAG TPA: ATP-binding SpoIIE family protein phosphatase [Candidatus Aquilonibacter sp.]|nr:ATP-binding SpoIIE family protein phosphatase [Candidatus Aquilonibacter sp.]